MGYLHYFHHAEPLTDAEWDHVVTGFSKLVSEACADGVALSVSDRESELTVREWMDRDWLREEKHGAVIYINGANGDAMQPLIIHKNGTPYDDRFGPRWHGSTWVKTQRKHYDKLVVAVLAWLAFRYPDRFHVEFDGYPEDWEAGLDLARRAFPDQDIPCPRQDLEDN
ncbi:hypothetical protein [Tranquillimonas alkanivorans]|uniref:Uncharacterized protein n=1 Tax=Tranquillimonas alkanivorans TaxID=441119 RepID=A0A1I5VXM1_9RHOB|nr:hypothetical protein [Tranquillimonas alkanivorans]SFQ12201.1 hypothetical protein SAMN04488047_13716 [Tranquillimonas alkanivorans]